MDKQMQFVLYSTPESDVKVDVIIKDETIWVTQKAMAELFEVTTQTISRHLKNVYGEHELSKEATCTKFVQVQKITSDFDLLIQEANKIGEA